MVILLKGCVIPSFPVWISGGKFKYSSNLVEVVVFEPTFRDLPKKLAIGLLTKSTQDRLVWDINECQTYISVLHWARDSQSCCGHNRPHPNTIRVKPTASYPSDMSFAAFSASRCYSSLLSSAICFFVCDVSTKIKSVECSYSQYAEINAQTCS